MACTADESSELVAHALAVRKPELNKKQLHALSLNFARQWALEALAQFGIEKHLNVVEILLAYPVLPVATKAFEICAMVVMLRYFSIRAITSD